MDQNTSQTPINPEPVNAVPVTDAHTSQTIPETFRKSTDSDWLVKSLILWFIPFLGGIIFLEDEEPILRTSARQSLITSCLLVMSFILLKEFWSSVVFVGWLFLAGYAVLKLKERKSIKISLVDDICDYIWNS